jgi:aryl-phospho-beta-D-glucosidase BglC (GH1 family)
MERWMVPDAWTSVGCKPYQSEFECVSKIGQSAANTNFANHWGSFITQNDINQMADYGLNTIRIPVGYWIFSDIKYSSEHFPEGQLPYLANICGWAADKGFYIIIDLHGAPFAQKTNDSFTGQTIGQISDSNPAFYQESQYERAYDFLDQMTRYIHNNGGPNGKMRNVGMLEVLNEPDTSIPNDLKQSLRQNYYPGAYSVRIPNSLSMI